MADEQRRVAEDVGIAVIGSAIWAGIVALVPVVLKIIEDGASIGLGVTGSFILFFAALIGLLVSGFRYGKFVEGLACRRHREREEALADPWQPVRNWLPLGIVGPPVFVLTFFLLLELAGVTGDLGFQIIFLAYAAAVALFARRTGRAWGRAAARRRVTPAPPGRRIGPLEYY